MLDPGPQLLPVLPDELGRTASVSLGDNPAQGSSSSSSRSSPSNAIASSRIWRSRCDGSAGRAIRVGQERIALGELGAVASSSAAGKS